MSSFCSAQTPANLHYVFFFRRVKNFSTRMTKKIDFKWICKRRWDFLGQALLYHVHKPLRTTVVGKPACTSFRLKRVVRVRILPPSLKLHKRPVTAFEHELLPMQKIFASTPIRAKPHHFFSTFIRMQKVHHFAELCPEEFRLALGTSGQSHKFFSRIPSLSWNFLPARARPGALNC